MDFLNCPTQLLRTKLSVQCLEDIDFLPLLGKSIMDMSSVWDYPTHKSCDPLGKTSAPGFSHQIKSSSYQQPIIK